ncbi:DpnII family type II restriction endonuclease [Aliicoccus persicus]|uniref:Type II restriction enzyme n=1 Tax=Aliicoccus persicus TaxID=930138 RepID=A0A662Z3T9_9STAP|nr:DpnII family type II restriction endonuclease [Aliicoccus persicus]SEV95100.1 type II restriction enzyme [Aliicoccus persicus]
MYSFEEFRKLNGEEQFNYFISNLATSNKNAEYFVNWSRVNDKVRELSISLNTLNYLLGKENIKEEARYLFNNQPELLKVIPILIAMRVTKKDPTIQILENISLTKDGKLSYLDLKFFFA